MSALEFIAIIFASGAVIEVWHKGTILAPLRARLQAIHDVTDNNSWRGRLLELTACPFCQSYHIPIYLMLGMWFSGYFGSTTKHVFEILVFGLAATRIGNIIDGLLPNSLRYVVDPFHEENK